ncbi:hypothetical protein KP509_29G017500 [Ceratopteris richardii]|uniref:SNRNP25 ubiquitin-like domain-containing protein n=1 Tax=Ceratopteris richardii TaxID=49495 RepID=A0A8T2R550_CERRI|nr:hypothetical protein KP509_29G017500 [Ceratopteris richardii]
MHLPNFLIARGDQKHHERIKFPAHAFDNSDCFEPGSKGDLELLIRKNHDETRLPDYCKTPKRFKAFASPLRASPSPLKSFPSPFRAVGGEHHGIMSVLIRRMDGTSFVLEVQKRGTLFDLKKAIQDKFEADGYQISWPHVWGHFCLSFNGKKLLEEHTLLYKIGIQNSDELLFVRHIGVEHHKGSYFTNFMRKHRIIK